MRSVSPKCICFNCEFFLTPSPLFRREASENRRHVSVSYAPGYGLRGKTRRCSASRHEEMSTIPALECRLSAPKDGKLLAPPGENTPAGTQTQPLTSWRRAPSWELGVKKVGELTLEALSLPYQPSGECTSGLLKIVSKSGVAGVFGPNTFGRSLECRTNYRFLDLVWRVKTDNDVSDSWCGNQLLASGRVGDPITGQPRKAGGIFTLNNCFYVSNCEVDRTCQSEAVNLCQTQHLSTNSENTTFSWNLEHFCFFQGASTLKDSPNVDKEVTLVSPRGEQTTNWCTSLCDLPWDSKEPDGEYLYGAMEVIFHFWKGDYRCYRCRSRAGAPWAGGSKPCGVSMCVQKSSGKPPETTPVDQDLCQTTNSAEPGFPALCKTGGSRTIPPVPGRLVACDSRSSAPQRLGGRATSLYHQEGPFSGALPSLPLGSRVGHQRYWLLHLVCALVSSLAQVHWGSWCLDLVRTILPWFSTLAYLTALSGVICGLLLFLYALVVLTYRTLRGSKFSRRL